MLPSKFSWPHRIFDHFSTDVSLLKEVILLLIQILRVHLVDDLLIDRFRIGNVDDLHNQTSYPQEFSG